MRHNRAVNHLGRKSGHRKATLANMASSLILKKRITTTEAKAKALKPYVEPLITKSKEDTTHSRRIVFIFCNTSSASSCVRTIALIFQYSCCPYFLTTASKAILLLTGSDSP